MNAWWWILLFGITVVAQDVEQAEIKAFQNSKTLEEKIVHAFLLSEYMMESDRVEQSQKWLETAKELNGSRPRDTMDCYIRSQQSELFYYMGLFQFGVQEAERELALARKLKDSAVMADAYLFIGINNFEMNQFPEAEKALFASKRIYPKKFRKRLRYLVQEEHIYNNISQLKLARMEFDSAMWYVERAYRFALAVQSPRGIPNMLQTKGRIFMGLKQMDSARIYLSKSNASAKARNFQDILLINHGYLMETTRSPSELDSLYQKSLGMIKQKEVNLAFQKLFFASALNAFKAVGDKDNILALQSRIIGIDADTRYTGNLHIQQISNQYVRNENKILEMQLAQMNRQRNLVLMQLVAALLCVILLVMGILTFRRKNRLQKALLEQKNDISQDLHDDIGSGLSSILIHADLLKNAPDGKERDKAMAARIEASAAEIAQRLHTFIWSLNNENDTVQDFSEYLKQYAFRLFDPSNVGLEFSTAIRNGHQRLNGKLRKNLFFCVKEGLNNALKHSGSDKIVMKIVCDADHLILIVSDNGKGLQQQNVYGNGLKNIRKRMESMGGRVELIEEKGLTLILDLPLLKNRYL